MALSPTRVSPEPCSAAWTSATEVPRARPAADGGQPLHGGTANRGRVVRVRDTVRRPAPRGWRATRALLEHLARAGFDAAPRVLATGPADETLSYIEGRAAVPPL